MILHILKQEIKQIET